jgi:hypothetical protein
MSGPYARSLAPALLLLLAACAAGPGQRRSTAVDHKLITAEEMRAAGFTDAFRAVQSLRPQWLRVRGPTTLRGRETIKVYLDGLLLGGPEQLQQITASSISSIRFLDAIEATQRWGLDHGQGAIVVSTRPGPGGGSGGPG